MTELSLVCQTLHTTLLGPYSLGFIPWVVSIGRGRGISNASVDHILLLFNVFEVHFKNETSATPYAQLYALTFGFM